jgi:hypothetical protein
MAFERLSQDAKQHLEIVTIDEGMEIDRSAQQSLNAASSRIETLAPDSNPKFDRFLQDVKQHLEMVSTDEGIVIDRSDQQS